MVVAIRTISRRSVQRLCKAAVNCVEHKATSLSESCRPLGAVNGHSNLYPEPFSIAQASMALFRDGSKSAKRKAAEELLQSRFSSPAGDVSSAEHPAKRRYFSSSAHVRACSTSSESSEPCSVTGWCDFDVCLPHVNWNDVATAALEEVDNLASPHHLRLPKYQLAHGIDIYLVDKAVQMPEALRLLKDSMEDSIVSIDLEWKPDFVRDTSKVALLQLSSATCCLLIRTCKLQHELPAALLQFLR